MRRLIYIFNHKPTRSVKEPDYDTLTFPESKFFVLTDSLSFAIFDSFVVINNDTINYFSGRSESHPVEVFNDSNIVIQILSNVKLWNTEELIQTFYYDQNPSILHPLKYFKKLYAGLIGAMTFPKFTDAVQSGFINENGHGHYAFVIKENGMINVIFEVWQENELNTLVFWSKDASESDMRYLLENIGITENY